MLGLCVKFSYLRSYCRFSFVPLSVSITLARDSRVVDADVPVMPLEALLRPEFSINYWTLSRAKICKSKLTHWEIKFERLDGYVTLASAD